MSLFDTHAPREKGSREWNTSSAVWGDTIGAYRVATPSKPLIVRGPSHILRIIAPHYHPAISDLRHAH